MKRIKIVTKRGEGKGEGQKSKRMCKNNKNFKKYFCGKVKKVMAK